KERGRGEAAGDESREPRSPADVVESKKERRGWAGDLGIEKM
ncbi:hypothetical protein CCACVL1_24378, partial [Corchorus capsularis]